MTEENGNGVKKVSLWVKIVSGLIGLCMTIGAVVFSMETRYAKAGDIVTVSQAVIMTQQEIKIMRSENQLRRAWERVWMLEKQFGLLCINCPAEYKVEYNKLKLDIEEMKRRLKQLES